MGIASPEAFDLIETALGLVLQAMKAFPEDGQLQLVICTTLGNLMHHPGIGAVNTWLSFEPSVSRTVPSFISHNT